METETGKKALTLEMQTRRSQAVFLLIFVVMAVGIVAVGYLSYQNYERQFRAQAENQLSSIAGLKVDELQDWRNERIADAEMVYRNPAFSERVQRYLESPTDAQAQAALQSWLDKYQAYAQYDRVSLLDANGTERVSSPAISEPVATHVVQKIAAVLSAGQVTFLDFHRDTADGPIHLSLLVPIYAEQDEHPLGLVVLRIDPNLYLYPYLQEWPVPSASAEIALIRREGDYAVHLSELRFQENAALNLRVPLEDTQRIAVKAVLGQEGIAEGVDYRGAPVIADIRAVPDSSWFLMARIDTAEVYAPLRARLRQTVVFFGALIVASGAGLGLVWRRQRVRYYRGQAKVAQALRESEERFRGVFENTALGLYRTTPDGRILMANPALVHMLGYETFEDLAQRDLEKEGFEPQYPRAEFRRRIESEGKVRGFESAWKRRDGTAIFVRESARAIHDESGRVLYYEGAAEDITEHKQAEAQILAAQAELQRLLAESDQSRRALLSVVEDQKKAEEEIRHLNAELEKRVRDRTAQLEAANKELEAFAYSVSHDLRAPLRALDGFSATLLSQYPEQLDEQGRHYLERIQEAARRMGQLIDDLLTLSRVTRHELSRHQVDLSNLAREIAAELQVRDPQRQVEFVIAERLATKADPHLLRIALQNLLDNAWKFTGKREQARIEIGSLPHPIPPPHPSASLREGKEGSVYFVRDNGVGFDMAYAGKLFAPFQRLHAMHEFPGTGIGLATVQRIVARHGGRVWTEAKVNQGATFYFTLGGV